MMGFYAGISGKDCRGGSIPSAWFAVVKVSELRAKAFQIGFDKDGSLFIHFPYFQHARAFCPRQRFLRRAGARPM